MALCVDETVVGTVDGIDVQLFTLRNASSSIKAVLLGLGATLVSLCIPDRNGESRDIVLGYDEIPAAYVKDPFYFGSTVGRYANRIAKGTFKLGETQCKLETNNGPNHLHGGGKGFNKVVWRGRSFFDNDKNVGVEFTYVSADGEEGYPGTLNCVVRYSLVNGCKEEAQHSKRMPGDEEQNNRVSLCIDYRATTDLTTVINLSHHSYFNLSSSRNILDHELQIFADHYLPVDESMIPLGDLVPVDHTPFDFRRPARIGDFITDPHSQIKIGHGYDHNLVLSATKNGTTQRDAKMREDDAEVPAERRLLAARVRDPFSGRCMEVWTTEPGIQLYTGNWIESASGKRDHVTCFSAEGKGQGYGEEKNSSQPRDCGYARHGGLCLETQHFPNSPNQPSFPTTVLHPDQVFLSSTEYRFLV